MRIAHFNEAGAKSAGKRRRSCSPRGRRCNFNEAGAKSAGKRLDPARTGSGFDTSMRPAQKAPENASSSALLSAESTHFNEAGAKSAGKLVDFAFFVVLNHVLQ